MSYHHLSTFDRADIQLLNNLGYSTRKIGTELGRHHSIIANSMENAINYSGMYYLQVYLNRQQQIVAKSLLVIQPLKKSVCVQF